ncbi:MAG: IS66 family transposase zinc-finger binding domain-containing protein [Pseudonocardia sp.]
MPEPLPSSVEELVGLVIELRVANAGLREVIAGPSKPSSSDPPYRKPQRRSSGRAPGQCRGVPGSAMPLVDNPHETVIGDPGNCSDCGADLSGAPVTGTARRQLTDVVAPPPLWVTEYQIITRACPCCLARTPGETPAGATGRAQYGPGVLTRAAELLYGHYLPVARATRLMASMRRNAGTGRLIQGYGD